MDMALRFTTSYLVDSTSLFRYYKGLGDRAMAQLTGNQIFTTLDPEMNSVAIIVKHLSGNMQSRWSNLLTSDGEKPGRNRDAEFENPPATHKAVVKMWEDGWETVFDTLSSLTEEDMTKTITIRSEPHSVMQAINRQLGHYSYHCGQIVFLAKHVAGANWKTLSIPRGCSADFNARVSKGEASQR